METGLKGKKALITGGGRGLGKGIALGLAREGVDLVIANRNPYPDTIKKIRALGVEAEGLEIDVGKETDVIKMVSEAINVLGGLDIYINNAAAHWDEPVTKLTTRAWMNTLNTNLSACVWACREVAKYFIEKESGNILIIGSTALYSALPGEISYRVSKSALKPYMELLAVELAPYGIRVNMLTPGLFPTEVSKHVTGKMDMILKTIPLRRPGDLDKDLAPGAILLVSDRLSSYTTGTELIIDGGLHVYPYPLHTDEELYKLNK